MSRPWYIARAAGPSAAEITLYSDIGSGNLTAENFHASLTALRGVSTLTIAISSDGGDVSTGFAIAEMLRRFPAKKIVRVDGIAASMASVIAMVGDQILMPSNAMMMIHNPWGGISGGAEEIKSFGNALSIMRQNIASTYANRTGIDIEKIGEMMDVETWLSADQAVKLGFADSVIAPMKMAAMAQLPDISKFKNAPKLERGWNAITENAFATFNRKMSRTAAGSRLYQGRDGEKTLAE